MSTTPPDTPEEVGTVKIDRSDVEVIMEGLKEMPAAMTLMATSIQTLADNTNKAPTRSYTALILLISTIFNVAIIGGALLVIRDTQNASTVRGQDTNKVVKKVADCLDILDSEADGTPQGECAKLLIGALGNTVAEIRVELRCSGEKNFRDFVVANSDPERVTVPPLSLSCQAYFKDNPEPTN